MAKDFTLQLRRNAVVASTKKTAIEKLKAELEISKPGEPAIVIYTKDGKEKVILGIASSEGKYTIFEGAELSSDGDIQLPESVQDAIDEVEDVIEAGVISDISKEGDLITATKGEEEIEMPLDYCSNMPDDLQTPNAVGGIAKGITAETLKKSTLSQVLDMILFPELQPTVTAPSASISIKSPFAANGVYEVGATAPVATDFNTNLNRGSSVVAGQPNKNRAGVLKASDSYIYYGGSTANKTLPDKITLGAMTYNYHAEYEEGELCVTSYGNKASLTPNPLTAGSVNSGAVTINGTYPYFCNGQTASATAGDSNLPSAVSPDTKLPLVAWTASQVGAKFASEAATSVRLVFDFPSAKKITKVEFYNPVSGAWDNFTDYTTASTDQKNIQGVNVAYSRLTTTGSLSGAMQMRFTVANA